MGGGGGGGGRGRWMEGGVGGVTVKLLYCLFILSFLFLCVFFSISHINQHITVTCI